MFRKKHLFPKGLLKKNKKKTNLQESHLAEDLMAPHARVPRRSAPDLRLLPHVDLHVRVQQRLHAERFLAELARERSRASTVHHQRVSVQVCRLREPLAANRTSIRPLPRMNPLVLSQDVFPREDLLAEPASDGLLPRVDPFVLGQPGLVEERLVAVAAGDGRSPV